MNIGTLVLCIGLLAICAAGLSIWVRATIEDIKNRNIKWVVFDIFSWLLLGIILYAVWSVVLY